MEFPGYVRGGAPKQKWPAFCYYLEQPDIETETNASFESSVDGTGEIDQLFAARGHSNVTTPSDMDMDGMQAFSCDAQEGRVKRLCPCKSKHVLKAGTHSAVR